MTNWHVWYNFIKSLNHDLSKSLSFVTFTLSMALGFQKLNETSHKSCDFFLLELSQSMPALVTIHGKI